MLFRSSKDTPSELWFDMDTAGKIALITENWHVQLCSRYPVVTPVMMYLIAHTACDKAFRVKIETLEYIGPDNPQTEIERCYFNSWYGKKQPIMEPI